MTGQGEVSMEEFRLMADRAGLGLSDRALAELKPIYAFTPPSCIPSTLAPRRW